MTKKISPKAKDVLSEYYKLRRIGNPDLKLHNLIRVYEAMGEEERKYVLRCCRKDIADMKKGRMEVGSKIDYMGQKFHVDRGDNL
jgi:hypothetical protein